MSDTLPPALVPADVDLRDFAFMPLDVVRLRDSGLTAKASGDEFRAAVLLWCASWHQVPAASLPDDDDELANICGYSRARREWVKVRTGAMRGWVPCADGRLYHAAVAGKALEAWIEKLASAIGGAAGNAKRWNVQIDTETMRGQFRAAVEHLKVLDPQSRTLRKKAVAVLAMPSPPESPPDSAGESVGDSPPDRKGQGQGNRNTPLPPPGDGVVEPAGFLAFWAAWPKSRRKEGKEKCLDIWRQRRLEDRSAEILAHVEAKAKSTDWTKQGREFVPAPAVYLRSKAWTGAEIEPADLPWEGAI